MQTVIRKQRVGLVLGAGGTTGLAFHAGTLLALHHELGWDARTADVIVGSSAGSIVGALLRANMSSEDIAAWRVAVASTADGVMVRRKLDSAEEQAFQLTPSLPFRRPNLRTVGRLLGIGQQDVPWHAAASSFIPHGWIDASSSFGLLDKLFSSWPEGNLWISAVRSSDSRRVVFGREVRSASLGVAVAASCAVPGLFRPVRHGGDRFIDGGIHSPTNADLLVDAAVDVAIVVSPMSSIGGRQRNPVDTAVRARYSSILREERRALEAAGILVHSFEPSLATIAAIGPNPMSSRRSGSVVRESFLHAGAHMSDSSLRQVLTDSADLARFSAQ
jgi:NTE family protein